MNGSKPNRFELIDIVSKPRINTNEHESEATGRYHQPGDSDLQRICFIIRVHSCPFVVQLPSLG